MPDGIVSQRDFVQLMSENELDMQLAVKTGNTVVFDSFTPEPEVRRRNIMNNNISKINETSRHFRTEFSVRVHVSSVSAILCAGTVKEYRVVDRKKGKTLLPSDKRPMHIREYKPKSQATAPSPKKRKIVPSPLVVPINPMGEGVFGHPGLPRCDIAARMSIPGSRPAFGDIAAQGVMSIPGPRLHTMQPYCDIAAQGAMSIPGSRPAFGDIAAQGVMSIPGRRPAFSDIAAQGAMSIPGPRPAFSDIAAQGVMSIPGPRLHPRPPYSDIAARGAMSIPGQRLTHSSTPPTSPRTVENSDEEDIGPTPFPFKAIPIEHQHIFCENTSQSTVSDNVRMVVSQSAMSDNVRMVVSQSAMSDNVRVVVSIDDVLQSRNHYPLLDDLRKQADLLLNFNRQSFQNP
jgi:hypothetical protein